MTCAALLVLLMGTPARGQSFTAPPSPGLNTEALRFYAAADTAGDRPGLEASALARVRALRAASSDGAAAAQNEDKLYGILVPGLDGMPAVARDALLGLERHRSQLLSRLETEARARLGSRDRSVTRKLSAIKTGVLRSCLHTDLDAWTAELDGLLSSGGSSWSPSPVPSGTSSLYAGTYTRAWNAKSASEFGSAYDGSRKAGSVTFVPSPKPVVKPPVVTAASAAQGDSDDISAPADYTTSYLASLAFIDSVQKGKGASESKGTPWGGRLAGAAQLPPEGYGYALFRPNNGRNYGTDDLVFGLIQVTADLRKADPDGPKLVIGDLSQKKGGSISGHVSHTNGRDADLVFFWLDKDKNPIPSQGFAAFGANGVGTWEGRKILFDTARNWALVKGLLTNSYFGDRVEMILVYQPLAAKLVQYAKSQGEDDALVKRAQGLLVQDPKAAPHNDHFHIRIRPSENAGPAMLAKN